ncbi:MAG: SDR family oxidoreductase [Bacteroidota bacterium]
MSPYEKTKSDLKNEPRTWLVTGVAGFIGSNLLQSLLSLNQNVVGIDNFLTGKRRNLDEVGKELGADAWRRFRFIEGDLRNLETCMKAVEGVDYVLHQAALGSVPRSVENPIRTHDHNLNGFLNILWAAKGGRVKRFLFASSSSVYGDHEALPKREDVTGNPLSPYAVTKQAGERYASTFARTYGMEVIGLRYFNVFGPRQDPAGEYAAVIPRWIASMIRNEPVVIFGDGETSRDFSYVENVIQANLLAAVVTDSRAVNHIYNVAVGEKTSLKDLFELLRSLLVGRFPHLRDFRPEYRDFRNGDIRHSHADISKAVRLLGYAPAYKVRDGLEHSLDWYLQSGHANRD